MKVAIVAQSKRAAIGADPGIRCGPLRVLPRENYGTDEGRRPDAPGSLSGHDHIHWCLLNCSPLTRDV